MREIAASVVVLSGGLVWLGNTFCRDSGTVCTTSAVQRSVWPVLLYSLCLERKRRTTSGPPNRRHGGDVLRSKGGSFLVDANTLAGLV
jgi:hypothetical protein